MELNECNVTSVYKETKECWSPSFHMQGRYAGDETAVLLVILTEFKNKTARVGIWGQDEEGMVRDFANLQEATTVFLLVIAEQFITRLHLESLDFKFTD